MIIDESVVYNYNIEEYEGLSLDFVAMLKNDYKHDLNYISHISRCDLLEYCKKVGAIKLREVLSVEKCNPLELQLIINETIDYIENML